MSPTEWQDPLKFVRLVWPDVRLYDKQREIMKSVELDDETYVVAGNMLGKDFIAGLIVLWFFLTRSPCRIVTTSVDHSQLEGVLWGEIRNFIQTAAYPLSATSGGPLIVNHMHLRQVWRSGICGKSYVIGRVAAKGEGMLGHHINSSDGVPRTMLLTDEASGVDDVTYERGSTWMRRFLAIGNGYHCDNFFRKGIKAGTLISDDGRCYRRCLRIRGEDSPNVRLALAQQRAGVPVTGECLLPGVLPWADYKKRRETWSPQRQCIGLDAMFWEGAEDLLVPPEWLAYGEKLHDRLKGKRRQAKALGIDTAEGGDDSVWTAVDEYGIVEQYARKTPDTAVIWKVTRAMGERLGIPSDRWLFDRGGGGKQAADILRDKGYDVRDVSFGERPRDADAWTPEDREEARVTAHTYRNLRTQLYWELSARFNPKNGGFAMPPECSELSRQLSLIPRLTDDEDRPLMLPKGKPGDDKEKRTLRKLMGCSPDEADSTALGRFAMVNATAGSLLEAG